LRRGRGSSAPGSTSKVPAGFSPDAPPWRVHTRWRAAAPS